MTPEATLPPETTPEAPLADVLRDYLAVAARLQRTHESLQREVLRLREEVESKNRELQRREKLAALGELAAGVAHEVRNPLGAIQLYSGLLRKEFADSPDDGALRLIHKIEAGIEAIDAIVQDTLALAPRARALTPCDVATLLDEAREFCQRTLASHGAGLTVSCEDPRATVLADPDGARRVLVNLVNNAVEASPPGATVDVRVAGTSGGPVTISVLDRGPGLSPELRERIFDPFFTTKRQGTGLGLTIAHRLMETYGGRLTARNRAEGGAEFAMCFPAPTDLTKDETAPPQESSAA